MWLKSSAIESIGFYEVFHNIPPQNVGQDVEYIPTDPKYGNNWNHVTSASRQGNSPDWAFAHGSRQLFSFRLLNRGACCL